MDKVIDVKISPYIPLKPDSKSAEEINANFIISIQYNDEYKKFLKTTDEHTSEAFKTPTVTIDGFVQESGSTSGIFNSIEQFSAFVNTLKFDDVSIYKSWIIDKNLDNTGLILKYVGGEPLDKDFICSLHSSLFNPTNPKGEDCYAWLNVTTENFIDGKKDEYKISSQKFYASMVVSFSANKELVDINEDINFTWKVEGDYVEKPNSVQIQVNNDCPINVGASGSKDIKITKPSKVKLTAFNSAQYVEFTSSKEIKITIVDPEIICFEADKEYARKGESVKLSWDTTSTETCTLNKFKFINPKFSAYVMPYFSSEHYSDIVGYNLCARGYSGDQTCTIFKNLKIKRSYWVDKGEVSGIDVSSLTSKSQTGIFFNDQNTAYIFDGKSILGSEDHLSYAVVSDLPSDIGFTLDNKYKTGFFNNCFFITGLIEDGTACTAIYDTVNKKWDFSGIMLSIEVPQKTNGSFVADIGQNSFYYCFADKSTLYIFYYSIAGWSLFGIADLSKEINTVECCYNQGKINFVVLFNDKSVTVYCGSELHIRSQLSCTVDSFSIAGAGDDILILSGESVYSVNKDKKIDTCYSDRLFSGTDEEPVIICSIDDKLKLLSREIKKGE